MGAIWLLCGYHPLLSGVFPYLPMVQFHLNHLDAFVLCCLQCAHLETSPSSYGSPSTGLKLFWFYNLQLLIPVSRVLCWPENRVTWMLEESLEGSWCNLHTPPCPWCTGNDSALQWRFFCECVVAQLQTWSGPAFRVLVPSSLQTPGCSSEEPLFLCCVSFYFHHCLGHF